MNKTVSEHNSQPNLSLDQLIFIEEVKLQALSQKHSTLSLEYHEAFQDFTNIHLERSARSQGKSNRASIKAYKWQKLQLLKAKLDDIIISIEYQQRFILSLREQLIGGE